MPAAAPVLAPALPLLALLTWWTVDDGGYAPTKWLPGTLFAVALLAVVIVARPREAPPLPRPVRVALCGLAGLTAFSYLSALWADQPGVALQGSHRVLLYAALAATSALLPWTERAVRVAVGAFVAAAGVAAIVALAKLHDATGTAGLFLDGRLSFPTGYYNATAALFTMAAIPGVVLASRRETPLPARPLLLGVATLCESLALMTESRGWLFTLPVVVLGVLALMQRRVRIVVFLAPVAVAVAAVSHRALEPYRVGGGKDPYVAQHAVAQAAHHVVGPIVIAALLTAVAGLALALADRGLRLTEVRERLLRRAALAVTVVAVLAGAGAGLAAEHHPVARLDRAWKDFKHYQKTPARSGASRFSALGTSRYDFWRVALDEFKSHPFGGIGQDNFAEQYLVRRRSNEEPRWAHSLELRTLTHTGIVGAALLLAALGGLAWGAFAARRAGPRARDAATMSLLPGLVWVAHGSVDWLWEFPGLSGWAMVLAGAGAALAGARGEAAPLPEAPRRRSSRGGAAIPLVAVLAAAALVVTPAMDWIAERDVAAAQAQWPTDRQAAFRRLDRAAGLDPSARPKLVEGLIAAQIGDGARARSAFMAAHDREPQDWFALLNLGLLASAAGDRAEARLRFVAALARDPREPVVQAALRQVGKAHPLTFKQVVELLRARTNRRFGPR